MSLYKQSVPVLTKYLSNLSGVIKKGQIFAEEKSIKHEDILDCRLFPDMKGLAFQVQACCNTSVWFVDRVGGLEHVVVEDNETTFDQLYKRIENTIEYLNKVEPKALDGKDDSPVLMETRMGNFQFASAQTYLSEYAIPAFHFHLSIAYCILRAQGVPLGVLDYLKDVFQKS